MPKKETFTKLIKLIFPIICLLLLIYFIGIMGYFPIIFERLDWWFNTWWVTGIEVLKQDKGIGLAFSCFLFEVLILFATYMLIKITIIDTIWPRFRIITPMKDVFRVCRKIMWTTGDKPEYKYCYVKFHLFPLIRWDKIGIPKPEKFHRKAVENGMKGVRWRRFPASVDVFCPTTNVVWDKTDNCYYMGVSSDLYRHDESTEYDKAAFEGIQKIGTQVIESVKGDWSLIKDQFHMGIVVREKELPMTEVFKDVPEVTESIPVVTKIQPKQISTGKKGTLVKVQRHKSGENAIRTESD